MNKQQLFPNMGVSLQEKTEKAIELLKLYEPSALRFDPIDGYYLAFSGGKDSIVIKELAKLAKIKHKCWCSKTTLEPPEMIKFIRQYHPDVEWIIPKRNFFRSFIDSNGPPTMKLRWCCREFKEQGGKDKIKILGVRASEGVRRKKNWTTISLWRGGNGNFAVNPILYWTDYDVWQFINTFNLPYCSLYDEGFERIGCIGCPMAGKKRARDFNRWPGFEKTWKYAFKKYFEQRKGKNKSNGEIRYIERFKTWQDYWNWWLSEKPSKEEDDCLGLFDS